MPFEQRTRPRSISPRRRAARVGALEIEQRARREGNVLADVTSGSNDVDGVGGRLLVL